MADEFLPPEPPGPEPDLGGGARAPHPQQPQAQQYAQAHQPQQTWQQPQPPPPPQQPYPPYQQQQHHPYQQQYAYQQYPQYQQPQYAYGQYGAQPAPWVYAPRPDDGPDNGPAVVGFVLAMVAAGSLWMSGFFLAPLSLACALIGIFVSNSGRNKVKRGETRKHGGLAMAGFITSIVTAVISALVTLLIGGFIVWIILDEDLREDLEEDPDDNSPTALRAVLTVAFTALRLAARTLL